MPRYKPPHHFAIIFGTLSRLASYFVGASVVRNIIEIDLEKGWTSR